MYIPRKHTLQLHKMQSLTFEQSQYLKRNETIETELAKYIPIIDVALIIADYAIGESPFTAGVTIATRNTVDKYRIYACSARIYV